MTRKNGDQKDGTPGKVGATTLSEAQLDEVSAGASRTPHRNNIRQLGLAVHN